MSYFQCALSSVRSIPWPRYYGEFNKVCSTKNARKAGLATIDLVMKNPLGVIATAALVILAWEFKKERNEHLAKQKEAESKLLEQKKQNETQSKTHRILERELQLQKAREVAEKQAKIKRVSREFEAFRRESTGSDTVPRSEATRLADEAAAQATLLAKKEVTDRLSTVLGWGVSRDEEATSEGLTDLIGRYFEAYQKDQVLKREVLGKLNELLDEYEVDPIKDLSEFNPAALKKKNAALKKKNNALLRQVKKHKGKAAELNKVLKEVEDRNWQGLVNSFTAGIEFTPNEESFHEMDVR